MTTSLNIFRVLLASLAAPLVFWVLPALQIVSSNAEYFSHNLDSGALFFLLTLVSVPLASLCFLLRDKVSILKILFFAWLVSPLFWLAYAGLMLDGARTAFYLLPFAALLVGWAVSTSEAFREGVISISAMFGVLLVVNSALMGVGIKETAEVFGEEGVSVSKDVEPANAQTPQSRLPDIYHIVLDEFQTDYFSINLDDDIRKSLAGFTWFPKSFTPSGRTDIALPAVFNGKPLRYDQPLFEYIDEGFGSEQSLLSRLKSLGYNSLGFLHKVYPHGAVSRFDETYHHVESGEKLDSFTRRQLIPVLWFYKYLPKGLTQILIPESQFEQLENQNLLPDNAPFASLQAFRSFLEKERKLTKAGGRYIFQHFILPHSPDVLAGDCSYTIGVLTEKKSQSRCAIKVIEDLVHMLKENKRFENSLIIVHADHGGKHLLKDGELVGTGGKVTGLEFSRARSQALVLVKPINAGDKFPLKTDNRLVDLYDIYPTILDGIGQPEDDTLVGRSLLAEASGDIGRPVYYHMYEKNYHEKNQVNDGPVFRYIVSEEGIVFDKEIEVPRWKKKAG